MGQEARVNSIPALKQLRASLGTFADIASVALDETGMGIQRTCQWLREDRYRYWSVQVRVRTEQFTQAKRALKQRQIFDRALAGTPSSCVDEKKVLKVAEARLREAEYKLGRVKAWSHQIEKEWSDYRGATQRLVHTIEVEIPNARARLDRMVAALEAYLALAPEETPRTGTEQPETGLVDAGETPEPISHEQSAPEPQGPAKKKNTKRSTRKMPAPRKKSVP